MQKNVFFVNNVPYLRILKSKILDRIARTALKICNLRDKKKSIPGSKHKRK